MQPGSSKHGWREDEQLKHDVQSLTTGAPVESRTNPRRLQEDDRTDAALEAGQTRPEVPEPTDIDRTERDLRAELAARTASAAFPADRVELLRAAADDAADEEVLACLAQLPPSATFANAEQVWEALGGRHERRH